MPDGRDARTCCPPTRPCSGCARRWCGAARRRRSGVSDDEARRFVAEHAHYTEDLAVLARPRPPRSGRPGARPGRGRRAGSRSRSPATATEVWAARPLARRCWPSSGAGSPARTAAVRGPRPPGRRATSQPFDLRHRFRLVIVAMNTLQVLTEPADRARLPGAGCARTWPTAASSSSTSPCRTSEEIVDVDGRRARRRAAPRPARRARAAPLGLVRPLGPGHPHAGVHAAHRARRGTARPRETLRHHRVHLFTPRRARPSCSPRAGTGAGRGDRATSTARPLDAWSERQIHRCRAAA